MKTANIRHVLRTLLIAALVWPLSGCVSSDDLLWILHPNGPIAKASVYYLVVDVLLLLIVIVPATALVIWAFFRYRRGGKGEYDPTFNHSLVIECIVWGVPLLLVVVLSYFTYQGVMAVDPYNPRALAKVTENSDQPPLKIDVITTDWQWLFVYPDQGIAVSNHLVVPTGRRIDLELTSTATTNDFYVLKVVNQIYIMPGMRTEQHFYLERTGDYRGFSTEFSGPGFSWMNYKMRSVTPEAFQQWINKAKNAPRQMMWDDFTAFAKPTINTANVWHMYSQVEPNLFNKTIRSVKSGELTSVTPMRFSEDMESEIFRQHSTGEPNGHRGNN